MKITHQKLGIWGIIISTLALVGLNEWVALGAFWFGAYFAACTTYTNEK